MPNPPTEHDWMLVHQMVMQALERIAAEEPKEGGVLPQDLMPYLYRRV